MAEKTGTVGMYKNLTLAEKKAINFYSQNGYDCINLLGRKNIEGAIASWKSIYGIRMPDATDEEVLRHILLHTLVVSSGLFKIPDYENPSKSKFLYRMVAIDNKYAEDLLKKKIQMAQSHGVSKESFMSTSVGKPVFIGNLTLLIRNAGVKNIQGLSAFGGSEAEILFPPQKIRWLYYRFDPAPKIEGIEAPGRHFIIGKPVK